MGVTASSRLRTQREFQEVRKKGIRILCGPFIFQAFVSESTSRNRKLGIVASRKVGNAVKRNLGKRQIRELFRCHQASLPVATHAVIILRSSFDNYKFHDLESRFLKACARFSKHISTPEKT